LPGHILDLLQIQLRVAGFGYVIRGHGEAGIHIAFAFYVLFKKNGKYRLA
jgi:hypothetical protein